MTNFSSYRLVAQVVDPARQVGRPPELDGDVPRDLRVEGRLLLRHELVGLKLVVTGAVIVRLVGAWRPLLVLVSRSDALSAICGGNRK